MPNSRAHSSILFFLACWLVLLASGDDINVARLMLPSADSSLVPLDDPNDDFTEPVTPPTPQSDEPSAGPNVVRTPSLRLPPPAEDLRTRTDCPIPLRCEPAANCSEITSMDSAWPPDGDTPFTTR